VFNYPILGVNTNNGLIYYRNVAKDMFLDPAINHTFALKI